MKTLKKTECKRTVVCATRLWGAIVTNLLSGTSEVLLINLAACAQHRNNWGMSDHPPSLRFGGFPLPKEDPVEWGTAGMTLIRIAYLFPTWWFSLPFIFTVHGKVPWTITIRQPFHTLKDYLLDVRHGADSALDKKDTSFEGAGRKVVRKCTSPCCNPKKEVTKESAWTKWWSLFKDHAPSRTLGIIRGEQEVASWNSEQQCTASPLLLSSENIKETHSSWIFKLSTGNTREIVCYATSAFCVCM